MLKLFNTEFGLYKLKHKTLFSIQISVFRENTNWFKKKFSLLSKPKHLKVLQLIINSSTTPSGLCCQLSNARLLQVGGLNAELLHVKVRIIFLQPLPEPIYQKNIKLSILKTINSHFSLKWLVNNLTNYPFWRNGDTDDITGCH